MDKIVFNTQAGALFQYDSEGNMRTIAYINRHYIEKMVRDDFIDKDCIRIGDKDELRAGTLYPDTIEVK